MKAVIFDLDGTLLNTLDDLTDATNAALRYFGCPERTKEEVRQFVGNGAERLIRLALPGNEDDPAVSEVLSWYKDFYAAHSQIKTRPYEGVPEVLRALGEKYPMAIVSNKPDGAVKALCADLFPGIYALGEAPGCPRKPAPDMVRKAMEAIGVDRCVYIGDSEVDILTAKNAGVPCVSVTWGFRDEPDLIENGATCLCSNPEELKRLLLEEKLLPPMAPEL